MAQRYEHVQALESRRLFAAVPVAIFSDITALQSDAGAFKATLTQGLVGLMGDARSLLQDFRQLPPTAQNRTLVAKLRTDAAKALVTAKVDGVAEFKVGAAKVAVTVADAVRLSMHPSAAARARLASDLPALQNLEMSLASKFASDASGIPATLSADLNAIASANPSATTLQNDITKAETDMGALVAKLQTNFQSTQGDFQHLMSDLKGML
jgi:hypothetical protein